MVCLFARSCSLPLAVLSLATLSGGCPSESDGQVSQFASSLGAAVPTDCEIDPLADAGLDVEATDTDGDGFAYVYLDATASEPEGGIVTYGWSDDGKSLAAGQYILVRLSVGTHPMTLRIEDACGREASDEVSVVIRDAPATAKALTAPQ